MGYKLNVEIFIKDGVKYIISSHHRMKGKAHKSYWTVSRVDEVECFKNAIMKDWAKEHEAWGLKIISNNLSVLGCNVDGEKLKIAKFVDSGQLNVWHGYPADFMRNIQDIPPTDILKEWVIQDYISKPKMLKIRQGQPCSL